MKQVITLLLFAAPFAIKAQEQPASNKRTAPTTTEKSISEKGVSSTKSRGISAKTTTTQSTSESSPATPAPAAATKTATAADKPKN